MQIFKFLAYESVLGVVAEKVFAVMNLLDKIGGKITLRGEMGQRHHVDVSRLPAYEMRTGWKGVVMRTCIVVFSIYLHPDSLDDDAVLTSASTMCFWKSLSGPSLLSET